MVVSRRHVHAIKVMFRGCGWKRVRGGLAVVERAFPVAEHRDS